MLFLVKDIKKIMGVKNFFCIKEMRPVLETRGILHEILTYINVYICKVGMPSSHPLIFPCDPLKRQNY